jgi:hypothetical protein
VNDHPRSDPLHKQAAFLRAALALGASLLTVAVAAAPSGSLPIDLEWEGPASCPRSEDIERDVRRFLGDTAVPETLPPIAARVSVRQNADGRFAVRMLTTSGGETRERALQTETCDGARDLVAFLLALLIDPRARAPSPTPAAVEPPAAREPPPAGTAPAAAPERAPAARRSPEDERAVRWLVGLSGSAEFGVLPAGSVGGEVRAGVLFSGWSIEGRGAAWLPRHAESPSVAGAGGEFTLFEAGILGCFRGAPWSGPSVQGCGGPALLSLQGVGYGVQTPGRDGALFAAAVAEAALLVAISPQLSLRPALGALVPFRRPTFAIHEVGTIHRPSAAAARVSIGFEVRF